MFDFIWDVVVDLVDLPIGRRLFGPTYREVGKSTPLHQMAVSGVLAFTLVGLGIGAVVWAVIKMSGR